MREIAVISGKGGTGKTTLVGAFASLTRNKVMVDCDVDAADLHLLLNPQVCEEHEFRGSAVAVIDPELCNACGKCVELCRFDSITSDLVVDALACEGCGVCGYFCPEKAIVLNERVSGKWFVSETRHGTLVHARLNPGEKNSGELVTLLRKRAKELADGQRSDFIIVDAAAGIHCPVIASLAAVDGALIVTEPTVAGIHDLERVVRLTSHFEIRAFVCINKWDLHAETSRWIERYCRKAEVKLVGRIPFDTVVTEAMVHGMSVVEYSDGPVSQCLEEIRRNVFAAV